MIVSFNAQMTRLTVEREASDPKFGKDESWFYYRVKRALKRKGYNCIKKLAYKDGNLVDDKMYYIRERKGNWMIYDGDYALRLVTEPFDKGGSVTLICEGMLL